MDQVKKIFGSSHSKTSSSFNYYITKTCFEGEGVLASLVQVSGMIGPKAQSPKRNNP